ncbi:NLR family CARD domain-containing protein 3-like isoform X2 [Colossoma macropomum]|uniref:NLR family CARD domain-containing protein 3-like isoform X2 n=1 Tax=Colossoma macropomum TaxID=42526 RepID=UPI001864C9DB|nr:NLR family CARD domain-containing protein 3-like isoform X2 [Colossoma macropomum]
MTSKMSFSVEQDPQKAESLIQRKRPDPPEPSCVSMKSDKSMQDPLNFRVKDSSAGLSLIQRKRPDSPEPSCVSMKSDKSMDHPIMFRAEDSSAGLSLIQRKRPDSPEPSCVSMKSDESMQNPLNFRVKASSAGLSLIQRKRPDSPEPSRVSMKSDESMDRPLNFRVKDSSAGLSLIQRKRPDSPEPSCVSMKSDESMDHPLRFRVEDSSAGLRVQKENLNITRRNMEIIFKELEHKVISLVKNQLKRFVKLLSLDNPEGSEKEVDEAENSVREGALKITLTVLRNMNQTDLANTLQSKLAPSCHRNLKSTLTEKFQKINEGISNTGISALLNEIYTELYITEGGSGGVNNEHEVRQIETRSRRPVALEKPIKCNNLFKDKLIRTVLTKGVAGIGKTVSVQKFVLDWAEGKSNQDILFIFPLPFRELNLMKKKKLSMMALLHQFFPDTKELKPRDYYYYKTMLIFDGLDECRLSLDFQNNESIFDMTQSASVDVLLTNLIKGNLLPSALLWITTRPAAANQIPPDCIDQVTEVRGFSDPQKEEYFWKRISDQSLAERIITHIKSSRSLYIMCHIPVFCWIASTVLERVLCEAESGEIPKTLTQMFSHFLIFQIKHSSQKYQSKSDIDQNRTRKIIRALGKLAFQQLKKGNLIFYEEDLTECGVDVRELSVYSGVCTQIFREEFGQHLGKVFSFVHLSVQEFLAALYAFIYFISNNRNVLQTELSEFFRKSTISDFLKSSVDKALQSENGHLDLYLRFLMGLSLESNQTLLRGLLTQTRSSSHRKEVQYIKEKIRENPSPEKTVTLFHCLNELNDHSLVQEVQTYLNRGGSSGVSGAKLSPTQWSAVAFLLLNSEEELDEFDLRKYDLSEECFLRLLQVVKESRKVVLAGCNLTTASCEKLQSFLESVNSSLKDLDLSNNDLQDSGVELLSAGLKSSHCKLEILRLAGCNLTATSCEKLSSALQSVNASLKNLDLSNNDLQDSGVELLSAGLKSSHCKLETLRLTGCMITDKGCSSLASALKSNPFHLRELDLTYNHPGESGVKLLSDLLEDPHCALEKLQVNHGGKIRMKPGLKKYVCDLTLDSNTANTFLSLSERNRKVERVMEDQCYPDHPDRFDDCYQVLSVESLTGRCYWEVQWSGSGAVISVSYRGIRRKGGSNDHVFGFNKQSWGLICSDNRYTVRHNKHETVLPGTPSPSKRIGVYLDWESGTLSFYTISPNTEMLTHLHTLYTTFTEPLYAGFWVYNDNDSSVRLCEIE